MALFKIAAHEAINNEEVDDVEFSTKYQVLCEKTAMVGVFKQKNLAPGQMKQIEQPASRYGEPAASTQVKIDTTVRSQTGSGGSAYGGIKLTAVQGRGIGTDAMLGELVDQYAHLKGAWHASGEVAKKGFVDALNDYDGNGLGDAFVEGKDDFSISLTDITNVRAFLQFLKDIGLDIEAPGMKERKPIHLGDPGQGSVQNTEPN